MNDSQKRRLGRKGKDIGRLMLKEISTIFCPDTILKWFLILVAQMYDGSKRRKGGRSRISKEVIELVALIARRNPSWGYDKIRGVVEHLGFEIGRNTIRRIHF